MGMVSGTSWVDVYTLRFLDSGCIHFSICDLTCAFWLILLAVVRVTIISRYSLTLVGFAELLDVYDYLKSGCIHFSQCEIFTKWTCTLFKL